MSNTSANTSNKKASKDTSKKTSSAVKKGKPTKAKASIQPAVAPIAPLITGILLPPTTNTLRNGVGANNADHRAVVLPRNDDFGAESDEDKSSVDGDVGLDVLQALDNETTNQRRSFQGSADDDEDDLPYYEADQFGFDASSSSGDESDDEERTNPPAASKQRSSQLSASTRVALSFTPGRANSSSTVEQLAERAAVEEGAEEVRATGEESRSPEEIESDMVYNFAQQLKAADSGEALWGVISQFPVRNKKPCISLTINVLIKRLLSSFPDVRFHPISRF
jgi:hypothetical protein